MKYMSTFTEDILQEAGDEPILAISIDSAREWTWTDDEPDHSLGSNPVSWEEAKPVLNYQYDTSFGGQDCHNIIAWTETKVIFIWEYDGSTRVTSVPRNPEPYRGI